MNCSDDRSVQGSESGWGFLVFHFGFDIEWVLLSFHCFPNDLLKLSISTNN